MKGILQVLESKTMWVNGLTLLIGYSGVLPTNKYTVVGLAVVNLALRLLTNKPIEFK